MVVISFCVFKEKILNGEKTQTIRPYSQHRWNQLQSTGKLHLWWKVRSKEREFLKEVTLKQIFPLRLYAPKDVWNFYSEGTEIGQMFKWLRGVWEMVDEKEEWEIVQRDGFESINQFYQWFKEMYGKSINNMIFMVIRW